ncbi:hypothetical protein NQZ68_035132 [Xyrichtys novacula]|uniref:Uncharacterized protein n=1 Tax=Xyrichtys novacula TaxID=13765 RepID=A0AAV1HD68_XYRNO|nr:hypothetical protein NQZ68_035132 [Xyrichtys novacula]
MVCQRVFELQGESLSQTFPPESAPSRPRPGKSGTIIEMQWKVSEWRHVDSADTERKVPCPPTTWQRSRDSLYRWTQTTGALTADQFTPPKSSLSLIQTTVEGERASERHRFNLGFVAVAKKEDDGWGLLGGAQVLCLASDSPLFSYASSFSSLPSFLPSLSSSHPKGDSLIRRLKILDSKHLTVADPLCPTDLVKTCMQNRRIKEAAAAAGLVPQLLGVAPEKAIKLTLSIVLLQSSQSCKICPQVAGEIPKGVPRMHRQETKYVEKVEVLMVVEEQEEKEEEEVGRRRRASACKPQTGWLRRGCTQAQSCLCQGNYPDAHPPLEELPVGRAANTLAPPFITLGKVVSKGI